MGLETRSGSTVKVKYVVVLISSLPVTYLAGSPFTKPSPTFVPSIFVGASQDMCLDGGFVLRLAFSLVYEILPVIVQQSCELFFLFLLRFKIK